MIMDDPEEVKRVKRKIAEIEQAEMKEVENAKEETVSNKKQRTLALLESLEEKPRALKKVNYSSDYVCRKERADSDSIALATVEIECFLNSTFTSRSSRLDHSYLFQLSRRHCSTRRTSEQTRISRQSYRLTFLDSTTHSRSRSQVINRFGSRQFRRSKEVRSRKGGIGKAEGRR